MSVIAVFVGEMLKLRKRPAVYVCIGLLLLLLLILGYAIGYIVFTYVHQPTRGPGSPAGGTPSYHELKQTLYPLHFVQNSLSGGWQVGGVLALIIGVLSMGSEFGWGTVKTALIQRPTRINWLLGKVLSIELTMLVMALAMLGLAALTSLILATIDGASISWPDAGTIVKGILAIWLIFSFWAAMGYGLATAFRQSAMAIGLGLAYALVIETLVFSLLTGFLGDPARRVQEWFPLANAGYLVGSFGEAVRQAGTSATPFADATHATIVLVLYSVGFVVLSAVLLRRDVTT